MDIVTRTFRAANMLEALQQVQRELGSDAIVVSMRKVPGGPAWQVWRNPMIEIIAMKNAGGQAKAGNDPTFPVQKKKAAATPAKQESRRSLQQSPGKPQQEVVPQKQPVPAQKTKSAPTPAIVPSAVVTTEYRESLDNSSVSDTIRALSQPKVSAGREWRPFIPPHISTRKGQQSPALDIIKPYQPPQPEQENKLAQYPLPADTESRSLVVSPALSTPLAKFREQLIAQGLEEELIDQLYATCMDILPRKAQDDEHRVRNLLQRQLEAEIKVLKSEDSFSPSVLFLIGSSGAGKTSSCAKLAAHALHTYQKKVVWVCADTVRTGAIAEARTFTDLLNVPLHLAYTVDELEQIVGRESKADLILVDTPDCNPRKESSIVELGNIVTQISLRSTFLVVSATTKQTDLNQTIASLKPFRIKGLIVTRMDESATFGNIYNLAWRSQIPLGYFTTGHHVFNDLKSATAQTLVDTLFGEGLFR